MKILKFGWAGKRVLWAAFLIYVAMLFSAPEGLMAASRPVSADALKHLVAGYGLEVLSVGLQPELGSASVAVKREMLGISPEADVRSYVAVVMLAALAVHHRYPELRMLHVSLRVPLLPRRDQYGNTVPNKPLTDEIYLLNVCLATLDKFAKDFAWTSYPVYAADRFFGMGGSGLLPAGTWRTELRNEMKLGGFVRTPRRVYCEP